MEQGPVAALTRMMDAVNAGDATAYARVYAEDAVITIYGGGELRGRGAIEQYEVELLREFPGARLGFYSIWQTGPLAVVHYGVNGQTANGRSMGHEGGGRDRARRPFLRGRSGAPLIRWFAESWGSIKAGFSSERT